MAGDGPFARDLTATMSTLSEVLDTTALCSLGWAGTVSGGSAEEKDHSSSSLLAAAGAGAGAGVDEAESEAREAKGSLDVVDGAAGAAKADAVYAGGLGVLDWEAAGDANELKLLKEDGPGWGEGPLAVLCCVVEESSAGPGMSVMKVLATVSFFEWT